MPTRAAASPLRARRRPVKAVPHIVQPGRPGMGASLARLATSREAKAAYIAIGTLGLTALAVAIVGPKRINQEVLKPIRGAVGDQAEKLWDESKPMRAQIASLFDRAQSESGRARLVRNFQSWAGHFRAT